MRFAWKKKSGLTLVHCFYGTLLAVQDTDKQPCYDWRWEKCGQKPGVVTIYASDDGGGYRIYFDTFTLGRSDPAHIHTAPGQIAYDKGILQIKTQDYMYTFHQILLPIGDGKCLGLVCDTDLSAFMALGNKKTSIINIPDPCPSAPWTDVSDILYAEKIFTFQYPDDGLANTETITQIERIRSEAIEFVESADTETVLVRCQRGTDIAYVRDAAMRILGWLVNNSEK